MSPALKMLFDPRFLIQLNAIRSSIYTKISDLTVSLDTKDEPFSVEEANFHKAKKGEIWANGHTFKCAQFHIEGNLPTGESEDDLAVLTFITGEALVCDENGVPTIGMTSKMGDFPNFLQAHPAKTLLPIDKVKRNGKIDFYMDAGYNGLRCKGVVFGAKLVRIDRDIKKYYYDYLFCAYLYQTYREKECLELMQKSFAEYKKNRSSAASEILAPYIKGYAGEKNVTVYAVGHSHLDLVWLWPKRETVRKSERTFVNQIYNIGNYPGYIYGASQPQQFEWIKKNRPELLEKIKEEVKAGRIELQGAMWVEADTNLAGGEALIRQIMYGQKFWKENFGFRSTICWLPDVFGYNGNLPQILSKSGVDNFMTIKLSWNRYNKFPHHTFLWKGIDDSEVLVHMPPLGNYVGDGTPFEVKTMHDANREKNVEKLLFEVGLGDGGGGPSEFQLEMLSRQTEANNGVVKYSTAENYFDELRSAGYDLPIHKGELYLEKHQGTYTTQCKMKKYNRMLEHALQTAETLWTGIYIKTGEYPSERLEELWKETLFYQFHDSLPGSSINRVYTEGNKHQEEILAEVNQLIAEAVHKGGEKKCALNTAPVAVHKKYFHDGKCWQFDAEAYSTAKPVEIKNKNDCLAASKSSVENDVVRLEFKKDGSFTVTDKTTGRSLGEYNRMRIYCDPRILFNAWEVARLYLKLPRYAFTVQGTYKETVGDAVVWQQELRFGRSYVLQQITLFAGSKEIFITNKAQLNRRHHMLRVDNKPAVWSDEVTCDIQYGNIKRATTWSNGFDKAQYEICSHKYLDLNDGKQGVAFLNDCKYGSYVKKGKVSINLIRNPVYPDPKADRGEQAFSYCIYPYVGKFEESDVVEKAYEMNFPVRGSKGNVEPLVKVNGRAVCELAKKGNFGKTVAVRVYEPYGCSVVASLEPNFEYKSVRETDLCEENGKEVDLRHIAFSPFEIKTLVFTL